MNIVWIPAVAIVIFANQRLPGSLVLLVTSCSGARPGVDSMWPSPYTPECVEGVFSEVRAHYKRKGAAVRGLSSP
jgi:hypothetical protein